MDHILPIALGGGDNPANLGLACGLCNQYKGTLVTAVDPETGDIAPLFNPSLQVWTDHFGWSGDGLFVVGKSSIGRATASALHMNDVNRVMLRRVWIAAGLTPPDWQIPEEFDE